MNSPDPRRCRQDGAETPRRRSSLMAANAGQERTCKQFLFGAGVVSTKLTLKTVKTCHIYGTFYSKTVGKSRRRKSKYLTQSLPFGAPVLAMAVEG